MLRQDNTTQKKDRSTQHNTTYPNNSLGWDVNSQPSTFQVTLLPSEAAQLARPNQIYKSRQSNQSIKQRDKQVIAQLSRQQHLEHANSTTSTEVAAITVIL